jgi:hypothetical protein
MKRETDKMNSLILAGHIDYKDQFKPKSNEIISLSQRIEQSAKKMQRIYDDKTYIQFCVILEEEMKYKEHNSTEFQDAISKLAVLSI